ncbi:hypothetical protein QNO00_04380 [Arthrobacter sp. zg-Y1219]|uniref:hypothetical protein n=1 Tax=Arthrobacter sp. zg-Y1219 TaxID=3049067 RepID=UPI0024C2F6D4|nr:hypothetical protein [Arthrobacter sp. zg-Y1219]MDK1359502.1 hypothetical protein [Arthrobacter sp. zg-Y1219]
MSNRNAEETAASLPVRHPEPGRRYSLEELEALAREGDPWALTKTDEWDQHFSNEYRVTMKDRCPDPDCDQFGEPATFCYGDDGELLDIDHGGWAHPPAAAEQQAKAS